MVRRSNTLYHLRGGTRLTFVAEANDKGLVQAYQAGDPDAFDLIVERYHAPLHAHALRLLHDHQAAEDAVQETFLRAFRALPRFNGQYRLGGWLHKILTNVCCDEGNRRRREAVSFHGIGETDVHLTPGPEAELAIDLPREEVVEALAAIPSTHRDALYMRVVEDRPYPEVADRAGISEQNARARVSRARAALRRMLDSSVAGILVVLPFLRRRVAESDVPLDGASSIAQVAPVAQATSQIAPLAQAGQAAAAPTSSGVSAALQQAAVHVAPVVQAAGPALDGGGSALAGKVAVAVTVAAAVAVPTGAAVHHATQAPPKPAVAPAMVEEETPPPTDPVAMSAAGAVDEDGNTSPTTVFLTSTTAAPAADTLSENTTESERKANPTTAAPGSGSADGESPAPATDPRTLEADHLAVSEVDRTFTLDGNVTVQTADGPQDATLSGSLYIAPAQGSDPTEPRAVDGTLTVTLADGGTAEIRVLGTAVASEHSNGEGTYELSAEYRMSGDGAFAPETGTLAGTFTRDRTTGTLSVDLRSGDEGGQPAYDAG